MKRCTNCPFKTGMITIPMVGSKPRVLVVFGAVTGHQANMKDVLGRATLTFVKNLVGKAGYDFRDLYITTAQRCIPTKKLSPPEAMEAFNSCKRRLQKLIWKYEFELVVAFGKTAHDMLVRDHSNGFGNALHWIYLKGYKFPGVFLQTPGKIQSESTRIRDAELLMRFAGQQIHEEWEPLWEESDVESA